MSKTTDAHGTRTVAVHAGIPEPRIDGAVVTPIFQSATYAYRGDAGETVRYLRYNNAPNQMLLHRKLAALEGGEDALVTASGMAAIATALLAVLEHGDRLLVQDTLYGGTATFVDRDLPRYGIEVDRFDGRRPETLAAALRPTTRAVYSEALTNPMVQIADHQAIVAFSRAHGLVSLIDSTFATPINFRPLALGYDLVLHSATKYLNGHSDLVAGVVVGAAEHVAAVAQLAKTVGGSLDAHACFLLERGVKTLPLRVAAQNAGAQLLAEFLAARPEVETVHYPGLPSHPDHARGQALFDGCGGVLACDLRGGAEAAGRLLDSLRLMVVAPSLGGVETLVSRPMLTSHAGLDPATRRALGIVDGQVRIAVGIEDPDDLIADVARALDRL